MRSRYRVGSSDESPGLTGMAHWLEHMNFKGTARFSKEQMKNLIERRGGYWNAYTWIDQTAYFETLPKQHLDLALESNWCAYPEVGLNGGYVGMESEGKAEVVYKSENLGMLTNACVICQFNFYALSVTDLVDMMRLATGFDYDLDELVACGERIWMLKRGLNNLMGVTAADDRLPKRMMTPFKEGGAAGSLPDMEKMALQGFVWADLSLFG